MDEQHHNARSTAFHRYNGDLASYNQAAREIMDAHDVSVIDLYAFTAAPPAPLFRNHAHFVPDVIQRKASFPRSALDAL